MSIVGYKIIGEPLPRKDGLEKLTGSARYGADVMLPGELAAAAVRSPYPHARILKINCEKARAARGVHAVITAAEINNRLFGQFIVDQPILAYDKVRYQGEPVALVAAEDEAIAQAAARLVEVEYEALPVINDIDEALRGDVLLHENWPQYEILGACLPVQGTNIGDTFTLRKGDVEQGFKEADLIVENAFSTAMLQHATIETHAAIAQADNVTGNITVHTNCQSAFMLRGVLAKAFNRPLGKIHIIESCLGGAFGCKYEAKVEPLAVALSLFTKGRPVRLQFSRHDEFLASVVRAPARIILKTGVKNDGTLVAQKVTVYWDTGAYVTTGPRVNYNAGFAACGPYKVPNAYVDGFCVMTNKSLGTAYRGFGVPEASSAHEFQMDSIAEKLHMDPLALRLKNVLQDGDISVTGERMVSVAAKECLEKAAENLKWDELPLRWEKDGKLYGKAIATFCKLTGTPSTTSIMTKLNEDGTITLLHSVGEMGQGATTVFPQIAAECMGMDVARITASRVDTEFTPYDKTTTSSRSTFHGGNATILACEDMKRQLIALAAKKFRLHESELEYVDGDIRVKADPGRAININNVAASGILKEQPPVIGRGAYGTSDIFEAPDRETRQSKRPTVMWMFGAQAAIVEVDPLTGRARLDTLSAAHDVGRAINVLGCKQQIEGAAVMGLGHALMEEMIYEEGKLRNGNMVDYKVPTFKDWDAKLIIELIEKPHPEGPYGAKGIGEPALAPTAAAIANAVSAACGYHFNQIPIKPEHILFRGE